MTSGGGEGGPESGMRAAAGVTDRPRAAPTPAASGRPGNAAAAQDPASRAALLSGVLWLSLGACVAVSDYLLAKPGQRHALAYGAVVAGAVAFATGLARWRRVPRAAFPWLAVAVVSSLPVLWAGLLIGAPAAWRAWKRASEAAAREAHERALRGLLEDAAAEAGREAADRARAEAQAERVRRALETVRTSTSPTALCDAALLLGRSGATEAVPDLEVLLHNRQYESVQGCAAGALVRLGSVATALHFYTEAAAGTSADLRRIALMGFGEIGPEAATEALPFLSEALRSPHWDTRHLAVQTLAKLGPAARPLLEQARDDPQAEVKELATRALEAGRLN